MKLLKDLVSHDTFPCIYFLYSLFVKNASCNRSKLIVACSFLPHFLISRAIKQRVYVFVLLVRRGKVVTNWKVCVLFILLSRNTNKMQPCNRIYYSKVLLKAQHVSSGTPLIIRTSKMYLQPLVYIHMWWPAINKADSHSALTMVGHHMGI